MEQTISQILNNL